MRKTKITRNEQVFCCRENIYVSKSECMECDDLFSIDPYRFIYCKRGGKSDEFIGKSGNIRSGRYAKKLHTDVKG